MSCCKSSKNTDIPIESNKSLTAHAANVLLFLIFLVLSPFITLLILGVLFYHIVLQNRVDIILVLRHILKKMNGERPERVVYEYIKPGDYELLDVNNNSIEEEAK